MSKIVLPDSPEAATYQTDIKGWVSRNGFYFGEDERLARYDGSTHARCGCGAIIERSRTICDACWQTRRIAAYKAMPVQKWQDGPACIFDGDRYFFSHEDFFEWCEEEENDPSTIRLVLCRPAQMPLLDVDFFEDVLPEDCGIEVLPKAILDAMNTFNAAMREADPISWGATNIRVDMAELKKGATCKTTN